MGKVRPSSYKSAVIGSNYSLRVTACLVVLSLHLIIFWDSDVSPWQWAIIIAHTLVYPHAAYFFTHTSQQENRNIFTDSFLYAFSVALWGFNPFLVALFISSTNMTNLAAGGQKTFLYGIIFQILGLLIGGLFNGFEYRSELNDMAMILASAGMVLFTFSLGLAVYKTNSSLRKNKTRLSARQQDLELINQLALAVNSSLDLDTIMKGVMNTLEKIYPFESLFVVSYSKNRDRLMIEGAYGSALTEEQENAFKFMEMDLEKDKSCIFVSAVEGNRIINISHLTPEMVAKGGELDKRLYRVKPSCSIASFPVYVQNQVVAGVSFINYETQFSLSKADLKRISEYLVQVGTAIKNVRMFEDANVAREQAEQSEQAKTRFLANMSHEIRTPMTAILGYSEALQDKQLDDIQKDSFLQTIIRSGNHLLTVINDILDISKIESDSVELEVIDVELTSILSDVKDYAQLNCSERSLNFEMKIQHPIPQSIKTDPTRLKQVLLNLCSNAIKFTEKGWVRIEVSFAHNQIVFSVLDSGIGLDEKEQEKIFDAFTQADTSTTRLYGGTGLGLSISKSLAHLMGGDLSLQSEKGKGSCFTLNIGVGQISNQHFIADARQFQRLVEEHKKATQIQEAPKLTGSILVAEDNVENQQLIRHLLQQCGLTVTVVENGQLAIDACQAQSFDLVLLDMQMPVMGGKEAANVMQRLHPNLPIVAFTANVMKHQVFEYLALGFSNVLEKPIKQSDVYEVLQQHLKKTLRAGSVLIVDDNQVNQMVLQRFVTKANDKLTIKLAHNGEQALSLAAIERFDLILMDMEMPVMGGVEATKKLRDLDIKTPIYMVSGNTDQKYKKLSAQAGADGHMAKPIEKNILFSLINELFAG